MKKFFLGIIFDIIDNTIIITVMYTIVVIALLAILYLLTDGNTTKIVKKFFTLDVFEKAYLYLIINAVLIITFNNLIFRNIFGFITIFITALIYAAVIKFFTGHILLFYNVKSLINDNMEGYFYLMFFAGYIDAIYYIGLARLSRLITAIVYRTTNVD